MPKQITLEEILKLLRERFERECATSDGVRCIHVSPELLEDFITTHFTEFAESLRIGADIKQHICAYNDGEQVCPCFHDARTALDEKINSALDK